jgi:hypothetical protein
MAVYQDFFSYSGGVYRHVTGALAGYHAVSVVGYDDTQSCWISKNSWGPGWGEAGFFRIGYGQAGIDSQFAFYDVDLACPPPVPEDDCERYTPALRRVLEAARGNPLLRACLRAYVCPRPRRPLCPPQYRRLAEHVALVLKHCPKYREPFCRRLLR